MIYALRFRFTKKGPVLEACELIDGAQKFDRPMRIKSIWPDPTFGAFAAPVTILHTTCGCMGDLEYSREDITSLMRQQEQVILAGHPAFNAFLIAGTADERDWLSPQERRRRDLDQYVAVRVMLFSVEVG